jgi:hypothetical protein
MHQAPSTPEVIHLAGIDIDRVRSLPREMFDERLAPLVVLCGIDTGMSLPREVFDEKLEPLVALTAMEGVTFVSPLLPRRTIRALEKYEWRPADSGSAAIPADLTRPSSNDAATTERIDRSDGTSPPRSRKISDQEASPSPSPASVGDAATVNTPKAAVERLPNGERR